ncbi:DUF5694 domain-containing protein [Hymenobacter sp. BT559]|uniref:DUF5694 domain-containing protein n=1 Tax=Hymenobacter sp. BT559 TaxID=2795729 RepID=UPI0025742BB2|nr:DUF5694 domain-containing protein [Hymenobacter sp. BT559]
MPLSTLGATLRTVITHAQARRQLLASLLMALGGLATTPSLAQGPTHPVEVMVLGCDHLHQLYTAQDPRSDVLSPKKQAELAQLRAQLRRFRPDLILVEAEPKEQPQLDSLYAAYQQGQLQLATLPYGRSERYQIGFALAKELHLPAPQGVDYTASTSQGLLSTGRNIALFRQGLQELQAAARPLRRQVQHDSLSVYDYLARINQPDLVALSHRVLFNTPAYVTSGTFSASGTNTNDLGRVDTAYIGAHYITLFYNRNLKIYSNLLRAQQKTHAQRLLVIFGQNHVKVQEELLSANPTYRVVPAHTYLKAPTRPRPKAKKVS